MAINVAASPLEVTISIKQPVVSKQPVALRNTQLDITLDLSRNSTLIPIIELELIGSWFNLTLAPTAIEVETEWRGSLVSGKLLASDQLIEVEAQWRGEMITEVTKANWVAWSNIGSVNFTMGRDNLAGERPMGWKGWVYAIKKLDKKLVVYGQNGISFLTPHANVWGMTTAIRLGLKGRLAVGGNESKHFCILATGELLKLGDKIDVLGYEEYLGALNSNVVLTYDEENDRVYICDGQLGFVYSDKDNSLGVGPATLTGLYRQDRVLYATAAGGTLTYPPFEICTDIYDLGNRKDKTILTVEFGVDASVQLYCALDWRKDKAAQFATTPWVIVNPNGVANIPCWCREFRVRARQLTYEYFELDYIKVLGQLHNYNYLDTFLRGRQV